LRLLRCRRWSRLAESLHFQKFRDRRAGRAGGPLPGHFPHRHRFQHFQNVGEGGALHTQTSVTRTFDKCRGCVTVCADTRYSVHSRFQSPLSHSLISACSVEYHQHYNHPHQSRTVASSYYHHHHTRYQTTPPSHTITYTKKQHPHHIPSHIPKSNTTNIIPCTRPCACSSQSAP
jgi:hypothetical protein